MSELARLLAYSGRYWQRLTLSLCAATLYGIASALPAYILKHVVDDIFIQKLHHLIVPFLCLFILFFAGKGIFMFLTAYYMHWVGNRVVRDIRSDLFARVITLPVPFFQRTATGSLLSFFMNDVQTIQDMTSSSIKNGVRSLFEALFLVGFAFVQNWKLACLLFLVGPFLGVIIQKAGKKIKQTSRAIQNEIGAISAMLHEIFTGIREIKASGAEKVECEKVAGQLHRCFASVMRYVRMEAGLPAIIEFLVMCAGGCVFYVAIHQVLAGTVTPGQLTSFVAAVLLAYQPLKRLIDMYSHVQYGLGAAQRIFALMDTPSAGRQIERTLCLPKLTGGILFRDVSFSYDGVTPVLTSVSCEIKRGQTVGIVGPSGSGKSTLCDLLLGFIQPTAGMILFGDHDITKIKTVDLCSRVGYVSQKTFLFDDTVHNNIAYPHQDVPGDLVACAARAAHADEFIEGLVFGYQTRVGQDGSRLSGGQKQRLAIARALLKDPDLLIFDEATSALDQHSESMIRQTIASLHGTKTVIVVSHRPAFLHNVDTVFEVRDGMVRLQPKVSALKDDFIQGL